MARFTTQAIQILEQRYLKKDKEGKILESPDEMLERVAKHVAQNEKNAERWEKKFLETMDSLEFLPNSPTLMNAGKELGQLSACFVLPVEDNLAAIFEVVKESALIHKTGGGTGFNFSKLRPRNSFVGSTAGTASGPVSFMYAFDAVTETVKQGGVRRGANLGLLNITHPDILEFINCKKDITKFNNFNISVGMTGKFLDITKNGRKHWLVNPHNHEDRKATDAGDLYTLICNNIWSNGEPGVIFLDTINTKNPIPWLGKIETTNPSLAKGTKVLTKNGIYEIQDLENSSIKVLTLSDKWAEAVCILSGHNKKLYKIKLEGSKECYATAEHKWPILTKDGYTKKTTLELKKGDYLCVGNKKQELSYGNTGTYDEGFLIGWNYGDGWITKHKDTNKNQYGFIFSHKDIENGIYNKIVTILNNITGNIYNPKDIINNKGNIRKEINVAHSKIDELFIKYGFTGKNDGLPKSFWESLNESFRLGFIDGLFSSDGHIDSKKGRVVLVSSHDKLIKDIQEYLGFYGINSSNKRKVSKHGIFSNGKDYDKEYIRNDLCIGLFNSIKFRNIISLSNKDKNIELNNFKIVRHTIEEDNVRILDIEETDRYEDVWDLRVNEDTHSFKLAYCITGNCGEQPLLPWESCNLGSIDLSKFVNSKGEIVWDRLLKMVETAVRFLDNIIDVNKYPRIKIARKTLATRKIGLGIMGWADMLLMMKIRYDSDEALKLAEDVMSKINKTAHETSQELGKEKGYFPANNNILKRRNATLTTIAPTGTLSMLADCSSSIEPVFAKKFTKTVLGNVTLDISKKYQKLEGDYFVTALDISPEWHVKMQSAFQKYVDNAVSKTINLPYEATIEDVKKSIYLAYDLGCKGITMYRQGTREAPIQITSEGLSECDGDKCQI